MFIIQISTIVSFIFISICLSNFSCRKNTIITPLDDNSKNPANYAWTIDTLYYTPNPQTNGNTTIFGVWGANDSSIFAVGHDEWGGRGSIWKYNGKKWQREKIFTDEGGTFTQAFSLMGMLGFSSNNIYAFGFHFYTNPNPPPNFTHTALVAHYDGVLWREISVPKGEPLYSGAGAPDKFFVGGYNGLMYKYFSGQWTVDTIKMTPYPEFPLNINVVSCDNDNVYLSTSQYNPNNGIIYFQFLFYHNNTVTLIDSTNSSSLRWGIRSYWKSPSRKIFSAGSKGIYKFEGNKWKSFYATETIFSIYGSSDDHIFALGASGKIYFFNGITWNVVATISIPNIPFGRIWCSNNSVFIAVPTNGRTLIYHGY